MEPRQHIMPILQSPSLEGLCQPYGGLCHLLGKIMRDKQSQPSNHPTATCFHLTYDSAIFYGATKEESLWKVSAINLMLVCGRAYQVIRVA